MSQSQNSAGKLLLLQRWARAHMYGDSERVFGARCECLVPQTPMAPCEPFPSVWGHLAVILGRECTSVAERDALEYVGAYTAAAEVSTGRCALGPVIRIFESWLRCARLLAEVCSAPLVLI